LPLLDGIRLELPEAARAEAQGTKNANVGQ
jgi:hypothetical protein